MGPAFRWNAPLTAQIKRKVAHKLGGRDTGLPSTWRLGQLAGYDDDM